MNGAITSERSPGATQEVTIILAALAIPVAALIGLMLMTLLEDALLAPPADSRKPDAADPAPASGPAPEPAPEPASELAPEPAFEATLAAAPAPTATADSAEPATESTAVILPLPARPYASGRGRPATRRPRSCARVTARVDDPRCAASRTRHPLPRSA
ncbi:hypothetical protein GCM10009850_093450 [Nonomuraea monospora]|uniref:Uncharacterized protein n=1 Tax=Nonomuraea monospora TaxID=568818 RepID=A0ABP5PSF3_9ACTN